MSHVRLFGVTMQHTYYSLVSQIDKTQQTNKRHEHNIRPHESNNFYPENENPEFMRK